MSAIDQILTFLHLSNEQVSDKSDDRRTLKDEDIPAVKEFWLANLIGSPASQTGIFAPHVANAITGLIDTISGSPDTVEGVTKAVTDWLQAEMEKVLALAVVQRPEFIGPGQADPAGQELEIFANQSTQAINGAVVATGLVLALNVAAAATDAGTQLASLGQIEGAQQLVQNVIWATGLADLGGLSFRPQISTSFAPLLERHYNSMAQAEIPGPGDLIRFLVRETFDPQRRAALEADETPASLIEFMKQRGFAPFWSQTYWAAHWNLLSTTQLNEALHRGVINPTEWERQVRLNDVVPEGIPWLQQTIYSPFTRVDVRRMGDLGVLTDEEMLDAYADIGYFAPRADEGTGRAQFASEVGEVFSARTHKAEALVVFTRVFNAMPSIRARMRNRFIRPEQVETEILALGVPPTTATKLAQELVKAADLGEAVEMRQLTTSQILRGYKEGLISFAQGQFLLMQLNWDSSRAEFLLRLTVEVDGAVTESTELGRRLTDGAV